MQRVVVATVTQRECDEYAFLFEKLLAYRSLKIILDTKENIRRLVQLPSNIMDGIASEEKEVNKRINDWWNRMDEKYILEYDDRRVLALDFNECNIYSIDKREWYEENPGV